MPIRVAPSPSLPEAKQAAAPPTRLDSDHAPGPHTDTKSDSARRSASSMRPQKIQPLMVLLPTFWFHLAWLALVTLQIAVAVAIFHYGFLFWYFSTEGMTYYVNMLGLMSPLALTQIANFMLVLSIWHTLMVVRTLVASIRSRRFAFTFASSHSERRERSTRYFACCKWHVVRTYDWIWYELLGRRGVFGVESPVFEVLFVLRELVEIGSQTYQTYRLTHLVASPWINNISTMLVICNCVSTPVVRYFCRAKPAIERALCLSIDVLLDICSSIAIPLTIFWPYYQTFDTETIGFSDALLFDDVWQIRALMENRQIYMTSSLDCLSKVVPLISMISSFNGIGKLLDETPASAVKPLVTSTVSVRTQSSSPSAAVVNACSDRSQSAMSSVLRQRVAIMTSVRAKVRANRFVDGLFMLWAAAVATIHLVAILTSYGTGESFGCKLSTRPWLSSRFSCAVLEMNCHRHPELSGGAAYELGRIMDNLESGSLASLIISHCPELAVPSQLQRFSQLLSMEVYNSTIVSWPVSAAISQQHHSAIGLLTIVRCNMRELPDGVTADLPRTVTDIGIVASNLTSLPHDLDARWPAVASLLVEQGQFTELPPAVGRMTSLLRLSFVGNNITQIADSVFIDTMALYALALSGNPLTALPASVGRVTNFKTLYLDHTRLALLPAWVLTEAFLEAVLWVTADTTPYCASKMTRAGTMGKTISTVNAAAVATASARVQELLPLKLRCSPEKNRVGGFFPLAQATLRRVP